MPIQHLVISGGGPIALSHLGSLKELEHCGIWNRSELKSVYGTSAGGMLGLLLCLKYDWDTLIEYFVKRPWGNAFKIKPEDIFNVYQKKGILGIQFVEIIFKPLFDAKNVAMNITMKELYEWSGIDLHVYSLELNSFKICDVSHTTHPDLPVLKAIQMTSAIPIMVEPVFMDGKCYVDGGFVNNYPLNHCLKDHPNVDDILSLKNIYNNLEFQPNINAESTLLDMMNVFCQHFFKQVSETCDLEDIPNQINHPAVGINMDYMMNTFESETFRQSLVDEGTQTAKEFIQKISKI
jgi:predicted acylesterase/phospholipase RssA